MIRAPAYIAKTENHETSLFVAKTYPLAWNDISEALENMLFRIEDDDFDSGQLEVSFAGRF
ncbi:MAG: hypothetical protein AAF420_06040, partial [Pseudomonadota bacterium]